MTTAAHPLVPDNLEASWFLRRQKIPLPSSVYGDDLKLVFSVFEFSARAYEEGKFTDDELPDEICWLNCVKYLDNQIYNGGFVQYISNSLSTLNRNKIPDIMRLFDQNIWFFKQADSPVRVDLIQQAKSRLTEIPKYYDENHEDFLWNDGFNGFYQNLLGALDCYDLDEIWSELGDDDFVKCCADWVRKSLLFVGISEELYESYVQVLFQKFSEVSDDLRFPKVDAVAVAEKISIIGTLQNLFRSKT